MIDSMSQSLEIKSDFDFEQESHLKNCKKLQICSDKFQKEQPAKSE